MADRYFVETPLGQERAVLVGAEAHHLAHVMRAKPGTIVTLFDGTGVEAQAQVEQVGRAEIHLTLLSHSTIDRELPVDITLGVALPKGDRQRWLVEKAVELGVARLVPLVAERSGEQGRAAGGDKLERAVIEASKQCGRNRLMKIEAPIAVADYLASLPDGALGLFAHPGPPGQHMQLSRLNLTDAQTSQPIRLAIGPEGGFTDEEAALAVASGWQLVGLDSRILRVETAALVLATAVALATK